MKKYIKNGTIIDEGAPIVDGDKVYYNPSAEIYESLGWVEYTEPQHERTLEDAKREKIEAITGYDTSDDTRRKVLESERTYLRIPAAWLEGIGSIPILPR